MLESLRLSGNEFQADGPATFAPGVTEGPGVVDWQT